MFRQSKCHPSAPLSKGIDGLFDLSKKPKTNPFRKVFDNEETLILNLRSSRNLGARRIKNELLRLHEIKLSLETIHKVLNRNQVKPLKKVKNKKDYKRYSKSIPGERIQMDTCKIAPSIYQYTAIDDFSRYLVAEIYPRRSAVNTLDFIEIVLDSYVIPIQYIQTDRGLEFMAMEVQKFLTEYCIKYRPNRPASPHLNGKVERVQKTVKEEFWATADMNSDDLKNDLGVWVTYYNYQRIHGSIGRTPAEMLVSKIWDAPYSYDVEENYNPQSERFYVANYAFDKKMVEVFERKN